MVKDDELLKLLVSSAIVVESLRGTSSADTLESPEPGVSE